MTRPTGITLRVIDGADRGRVYRNLACPITVGREEGNSVQLNDERVSRFHLKIQEDQERIVLTDLDSTNGTRVNGEDTQLKILRFGDVILVGRSSLVYGTREQVAERLAQASAEGGEVAGVGCAAGAHAGRARPAGRLPRPQHPPAGRAAGSRARHGRPGRAPQTLNPSPPHRTTR